MCEWNREPFTFMDHTEDTDIKLLSKDLDNSGKLASDCHWTCYSVGKVWCTFDSMYGLNTLDWRTCCHSQQHMYSKVIFLIFTRLKTKERKWLNVEPDIGLKLRSLRPVTNSMASHHKECWSSHYFRQHFQYKWRIKPANLRYTRVNKNPSAWNFLSPKPEVTCGTVAIIIRVVFLSPYLRIRAVSLSSIHYNQSHRVYINRRRQYICLIWN